MGEGPLILVGEEVKNALNILRTVHLTSIFGELIIDIEEEPGSPYVPNAMSGSVILLGSAV